MTVGTRLPVVRIVGLAYCDVYRSLLAMKGLAGALVLIVSTFALAPPIASQFLMQRFPSALLIGGWPLRLLTDFALEVAQNFLLTPILIAVHRFILMDKVTRFYVLVPSDPRFWHFFGWTVAISAVFVGSRIVTNLLVGGGLPPSTASLLSFVPSLIAVFFSLRLIILFPAIAVGRSRLTAADAFADTQGHAWRIFLILLLASIPLVGLLFGVLMLPWSREAIFGGWAASAIAGATVDVIGGITAFPLFAAMASRIFQVVTDRVLVRPPHDIGPIKPAVSA